MELDFSVLLPRMSIFLTGTWVTIWTSILALLFGTALGLTIGVLRVVPCGPLRTLAWSYIFVIRGTPCLIQLFFIYFGLPALGVNLPAIPAGIIGLSLNSAGYVGEIVRGGIEAVPRGQWEAARMLGLSYLQSMRLVVLPQAVRNMLPAFGNEFVTLIKESSLLSTLAITELTQAGQQVRSATYASFETFAVVGAIYLTLTTITGMCLRRLEKKWSVA
ncbi:MAG: amino acid ABC transporter permease [Synergistaceae bacterium]|jgi:polar amino acid transport system permease protein|nr:amino acid ABC transporter permease [Synergistaceae bacterium]